MPADLSDRMARGIVLDPDPEPQERVTNEDADGESGDDDDAEPEKRGPLLDKPDAAAARLAGKMWAKQDRTMKSRKARWSVNRMVRIHGIFLARIIRDSSDTAIVRAFVPPGAFRVPPAMNKLARLCRRMASVLFVDPPSPECSPPSDTDEDRDAAELAQRVLEQEGSEDALNLADAARRATDVASDCGSGFLRFYVDPMAGGHRPRSIQCQPQAETVDDALVVTDPETGAQTVWEGDLITRYVMPDGKTLTDDPLKSDREWLPKLRREVLDGSKVRFIPETAFDIAEADGVMIGCSKPISELKRLFPETVGQMGDDELRKLIAWTPDDVEALREGPDPDKRTKEPELKGDEEAVTITVYYKQTGEYPFGCYAVFGGNSFRLYGDEWSDPKTREPLPLPLAQFKQFSEGDEEDAYGYGLTDLLRGANELRGMQNSSWAMHLERFLNPKYLLPMNGPTSESDLRNPKGAALYFYAALGEPKVMETPEYSESAIKFAETLTQEMDDEAMLAPAAQGEHVPGVNSGLHAQQLIEQTNVGLAGLKQNIEKGIVQSWRVMLALIKAFYTTEQTLIPKDGRSFQKQRSWMAADLGSVSSVRILRGSFTGMTQTAKAANAEYWSKSGLVPPESLKRYIVGAVSGTVGQLDDPHETRIERQTAEFLEGPPDGWQPQPPPQPDPMTGQPAPQQPDPVFHQMFDNRPVDVLPPVAVVRVDAMARVISSPRYGKLPPGWRALFEQEFQRMQQAAAPQPPPPMPRINENIEIDKLPPDFVRQWLTKYTGIQVTGPTAQEMQHEQAMAAAHAGVSTAQAGAQRANEGKQTAAIKAASPANNIPDPASGQPSARGVTNILATAGHAGANV